MDVKVRYANHYGLRGAFIWEVDTDNFRGMYGKPSYNILQAVRSAVMGGQGLEAGEVLGSANENMNCSPQAPFCDVDFGPGCSVSSDCNTDISVICDNRHSNCFYCDTLDGACKPGEMMIITNMDIAKEISTSRMQ